MDEHYIAIHNIVKTNEKKEKEILLLLFSIIIPSAHLTLHMYVVVMQIVLCMYGIWEPV